MNEKYACHIDQAQQRADELTADSLAAIRSLVPQEKHEITPDDLECIQCSGPISEGRAKLGMDICIDCARENERYAKHFSKSRSRGYDYDD